MLQYEFSEKSSVTLDILLGLGILFLAILSTSFVLYWKFSKSRVRGYIISMHDGAIPYFQRPKEVNQA
jgi:hypothetical protein